MTKLLPAIAAVALLAACEAKIGKEDAAADAVANGNAAAADGQAAEGQFSTDAPGFSMKLDIPEGIASRASFDSDNGLLYPGTTFSGMHIAARDRTRADEGVVELRFTSTDDPARIAAWYRDPARAKEIAVASVTAEGSGFAIAGTQTKDGDPFTIRLAPRNGGGTDGRLTLADRR